MRKRVACTALPFIKFAFAEFKCNFIAQRIWHMAVTKYVLPVVVGAMSGMMLITFGEIAIHHLYPMPGVDLYDADSLAKGMKTMPANAFALMLVNYALCSFFAGLIATLVGRRTEARPAIIVGIVLTLAGIYNAINLPHPAWFYTCVLVYLPSAYLGYLTVRRKVSYEREA